jgi:GNAT superfamily N-acetyltransferase/adenylylsulfate kinase-like enzyme
MPDILILTGTCGVGKSTISWQWAQRRLGATIDCDIFRTWIRSPVLITADGFQEMLLARQAARLAEEYMALGLDVAINNAWMPEGLAYLRQQLADRARVRMVWLVCDAAENHERDQRRSPSDVMGGRLDELQAELDAFDWPADVVRLDTTGQTVDQTIATIEGYFDQEPGMRMNGLALRASTLEDTEFLYAVTKETITEYARQTWDLSPEELEKAMRDGIIIGQDQIVMLHGRKIGVLSVEHKSDEHFIDKILILPDYQRWGIGTHLVRCVLAGAFGKGLPVRLHVLKVNPARRLYERLGFVPISESQASYVMQALPPAEGGGLCSSPSPGVST